MSPRELDLFDFAASGGPSPVPIVIGDVAPSTLHWLVVTTKRARTGCGIIASSYQMSTRIAICEDGAEICCTLDAYSDKVTCQACKEAI